MEVLAGYERLLDGLGIGGGFPLQLVKAQLLLEGTSARVPQYTPKCQHYASTSSSKASSSMASSVVSVVGAALVGPSLLLAARMMLSRSAPNV